MEYNRPMRNLILAACLALASLLTGHAAHAACPVPNPNLLAPPFVDGCPLPAVALNRLGLTQAGNLQAFGTGVKCDDTTDDTTAINSALTLAATLGVQNVVGPAYKLCKITSSLNVPDKVSLSWASYSNYGTLTSGIDCEATAGIPCIVNGTGDNLSKAPNNLDVIENNATSGTTCVEFNGGFQLHPHDITCYGTYNGFTALHTASGGSELFADHLNTCGLTGGVDFTESGNYASLHVSDSDFGCNGSGDQNDAAYVEFYDISGSGNGPNYFVNDQFNHSGGQVSCGISYVASPGVMLTHFVNVHMEQTSTGVCTDAATTLIAGLNFDHFSYVPTQSTDRFWDQLNSATVLEDVRIDNSTFFGGEPWTLATSANVYSLAIDNTTFYNEVTVNLTGSVGEVNFGNGVKYGNAGVGLLIEGGYTSGYFGGMLSPAATTVSNLAQSGGTWSPVEINIPGVSLSSNCSASMALQFNGSATGVTYTTAPICYWTMSQGKQVTVNFYLQVSGLPGSGTPATLTGLPLVASSSIGNAEQSITAVNMNSGVTGGVFAVPAASASTVSLDTVAAGGYRHLAYSDFSTTTVLTGTINYLAK
jgi:hypothetical protein